MWAKLLEAIIQVLPKLVMTLSSYIIKTYSDYQKKRKQVKESKKKADDYKKADTKDDARDSFNKLP